ncbi:MAG: 2'-deoxycytidine 5'-triphosphate deaminase, partial [Dehalococcoidia bacterium]|nr:2'-deoxycytidine 5'-triphosphate deaminase [Dehalococcoidia bacterium]
MTRGVPARHRQLASGVLPDRELRGAIQERWISASIPIADAQIQPASLDLRL